ncbi:hypothetical protein BDF19DRAFT_455653, partial [Syncephalis fuscata]
MMISPTCVVISHIYLSCCVCVCVPWPPFFIKETAHTTTSLYLLTHFISLCLPHLVLLFVATSL